MVRILGVVGLGVVALSWAVHAKPTTGAAKPNILFLFPDQWRSDWDGEHDNWDGTGIPLKIPTIRSLIANGTKFSNTYVAAPVCAPSRSCLASGREYDRAGVACNFCNDFPVDAEKTFYNQLEEAGHHTMVCGKDDLTKKSSPGIDGEFNRVALGFSDGLRACGKDDVVSSFPKPHEPYGVFLNDTMVALEDGTPVSAWLAHAACMGKGNKSLCDRTSFPGSTYEDNWTAENAMTLIGRRPMNKPFFIQVNFPGPHPPFLVTSDMEFAVENRTYTGGVDSHASNTKTVCIPTGEPSNNPESQPSGRCDYAAEIENLDSRMADIIEFVRKQGVIENTIIVWASDHGTMLGDHNDQGKTMPWEGSAHVPMVVTGPNVPQARHVILPVTIMDLAATFLDYGAGSLAPGMTSQSMKGIFEGTNHSARDFISSGLQNSDFNSTEIVSDSEMGGGGFNWRMVVRYYNDSTILKFICCKGKCNGEPSNVGAPVEGYTQLLYNTVADPFDMHPLTEKPQYAGEIAHLRSLLPTDQWTCGQ